MEPPPNRSIPLGDFLQKLAMLSYEEMRVLLEAMPQQTALIRAEKLEELMQKSKRQYTQVYSILEWIKPDHVREFLKSTLALQDGVAQETTRLNTKLDTLYYLKAGDRTQFISPLSSKRIRSMDSVAAAEILSCGSYPFLPESIFDLSLAPLPSPPSVLKAKSTLDSQTNRELSKKLELTIRSKIFTTSPIPEAFSKISFDSTTGMLLLTCPDLFVVCLSLSDLAVEAAWEVVDFQLLIKPHANERLDIEFSSQDLEQTVVPVLKQLSTIAQKDIEGNMSSEDCFNDQEYLRKLFLLCQHAALSVTLRYIYIQALSTIGTCYQNTAETFFHETNTFQICTIRLWNSAHTTRKNGSHRSGIKRKLSSSLGSGDIDHDEHSNKQYEYEVQIYLSRVPGGLLKAVLKSHDSSNKNDRNPESVDLDLLDASLRNENKSYDVVNTSKISLIELDISNCLREGVDFTRLMLQVIKQCALQRLQFLCNVIQTSPAGIGAMKQGVDVSVCATNVNMTISLPGYVDVLVQVNAKTGLFVVTSTALCVQLTDRMKGLCVKFQKDLLALLQVERSSSQSHSQTNRSAAPIHVTCSQKNDDMDVNDMDCFNSLPTLSPYANILVTLGPLFDVMILSKWVDDVYSLPDKLSLKTFPLDRVNTNLLWFQHLHSAGENSFPGVNNSRGGGSVRDDDAMSVASSATNVDGGGGSTDKSQGVLFPLQTWVDRVYLPEVDDISAVDDTKGIDCFDSHFYTFIALSVEVEAAEFSIVPEYYLCYCPVDPSSPTISSLRLPSLLYKDKLQNLAPMVDPVAKMLSTSTKSSASTVSPQDLAGMINDWTVLSRLVTLDILCHLASPISLLKRPRNGLIRCTFSTPSHLPLHVKMKRNIISLPSSTMESIVKHTEGWKRQENVLLNEDYFFPLLPGNSFNIFESESTKDDQQQQLEVSSQECRRFALINMIRGEFTILIMSPTAQPLLCAADMKNYISTNAPSCKTVCLSAPFLKLSAIENDHDISLAIDQNHNLHITSRACRRKNGHAVPTPISAMVKLSQFATWQFPTIIAFVRSVDAGALLPVFSPKESVAVSSLLKVYPGSFSVKFVYPTCDDLTVEVDLALLSAFNIPKQYSFSKTASCIWDEILSLSISAKPGSTMGSISDDIFFKTLVGYYRRQVEEAVWSERDGNDKDFDWYRILKNAAIMMLPLVLVTRSLQLSITQRNTVLSTLLKPSENDTTAKVSEQKYKRIDWDNTRCFSANKIFVLLKIHKEQPQNSNLYRDENRSLEHRDNVNDSPQTVIRNFQIELQLDALDTPPQKLGWGSKRKGAILLEHIGVSNLTDGIFQKTVDKILMYDF